MTSRAIQILALCVLGLLGCLCLSSASWAIVAIPTGPTYNYSVNGTYDLIASDPTLSGSLTVTGSKPPIVTGADIFASDPNLEFNDVVFQQQNGSQYDLNIKDSTNEYVLFLVIDDASDLSTGQDATIDPSTYIGMIPELIPMTENVQGTLDITATPLPATLPLFAGGLGFVGYLTGRKKRKAGQALAAA